MPEDKKTAIREKIENVVEILGKASDDPHEKDLWNAAFALLLGLAELTKNKIDDFFVKMIVRILRRKYDIPEG